MNELVCEIITYPLEQNKNLNPSYRWDFFQVGNKLVKEMDRMEAFKIGLTTWGKWLDSNIDPSKTTVFFQGVSAVHIE